MHVSFGSERAPGMSVNEDLALAGNRFAMVLDGATAPPGIDSGCRHDVAWFVGRLGGELGRLLAHETNASLADCVAAAIAEVNGCHADTCDLGNPASPSSTVTIVRESRGVVEHFVLGDSPLVLGFHDGEVVPIRDRRLEMLEDRSYEAVRDKRNVPGGFWVASTKPEAAYEAFVGDAPLERVAAAGIFSDGASRLAERYGMSWRELLDLLEREGPDQVIQRVRKADAAAGPTAYGGKQHDDATALLCRFTTGRDGAPAELGQPRSEPAD